MGDSEEGFWSERKKEQSKVAGRRNIVLMRTTRRGMSELIVNGKRIKCTVDADGTALWSVADFVGSMYGKEPGGVSKLGSVYLQRFRREGSAQHNLLKERSTLVRFTGARGALSAAMDAHGLCELIKTMKLKKNNTKIAERAHAAYKSLMDLQ